MWMSLGKPSENGRQMPIGGRLTQSTVQAEHLHVPEKIEFGDLPRLDQIAPGNIVPITAEMALYVAAAGDRQVNFGWEALRLDDPLPIFDLVEQGIKDPGHA